MSFLEASSVTFTHRKISNKVFSNLPVNFSLSFFFFKDSGNVSRFASQTILKFNRLMKFILLFFDYDRIVTVNS